MKSMNCPKCGKSFLCHLDMPILSGGHCSYPIFGKYNYKLEKTEWYFYDETWSNEHGPFKTLNECELKLSEYCETL